MKYEEFLKEQIESAKAWLEMDPESGMAHGLYNAYSRALDEWRKHREDPES